MHRTDNELTAILRIIATSLYRIETKVNKVIQKENYMADALQAAYDTLESEVQDTENLEARAATELQSLAGQLADIQPGTAVTPEQLQGLATGLTNATQALKSAADSAEPAPATTDTPPATTDPAPVPADEPAVVVTDPSGDVSAVPASDAPAPADEPAPADTPPAASDAPAEPAP